MKAKHPGAEADERPWRVRHSQTLYRNALFSLRRDACVRPDAGPVPPWYVWELQDWANVVALTARRELVLVRQYRHAAGYRFYEFPGGVVEGDEAAVDGGVAAAAVRELREETGFVPGRLESLGSLFPNPALQNNRLHVFLALDCERVCAPTLDAGEDLVTELVDLDTYLADNGVGLPRHALMVASFALALPRLRACYPEIAGSC